MGHMSDATQTGLGAVVSLLRYPVKSMMGEELDNAEVRDRGVLGDRAYALLDSSNGKVASAKNPSKWPGLFAFRANFIEPADTRAQVPPVRITLPDGTSVTSEQSDLSQVLSKALNREVTLAATDRGQVVGVQSPSTPASGTANAEEDWPEIAALEH